MCGRRFMNSGMPLDLPPMFVPPVMLVRQARGPRAQAAGLATDRTMMGQPLETFVYQALRRQASWRADSTSFLRFRNRDGAEVEIVIERGTQALAGVEVKAGGDGDFGGVPSLAETEGRCRRLGSLVMQLWGPFCEVG